VNLLIKMAIRAKASDLVQFHLKRGCNINQQDTSGTSLLMFAAIHGSAEICQILLDAGADPALKNRQGLDVLDLASASGHADVETLLRAAFTPQTAADNSIAIEELTDDLADTLEFDATAWEAEVETPVPDGDLHCLDSTHALQHILSFHVPIDTDADWSDVEIDLPNWPSRQRDRLWAERWARISPLLIQGLQSGRLSRVSIECALQHDEPDLDIQELLLNRVIGELGQDFRLSWLISSNAGIS
jgi:RNA polymerase primary sigma factor